MPMPRLACLALLLLSLPSTVRADWPLQRHDRERTGVATGEGNITDPTPYYRYYLGGSLFRSAMLPFDVNADGSVDVIMLTGGRVVARSVTDEDLWSSAPRGFVALVGLADLDDDGALDLVVRSGDQVFVLDPRTGAQLWEEPLGEMGTLSGTRLADFDGDGSVDLLVAECACCGVNSGYPGAIYTFTDGFASARHLWEIPEAHCGYSRVITVVDVDGTGPPELLLSTATTLRIYRPATDELVAESPDLGARPYWNRCWPAQLDADPGDEIVCVLMENNSALVDRWRITVFDVSAPGTLAILWSTVLVPDATGGVRVADPIVDLDGDGTLELVVAVLVDGTWETRIYDAAAGALEETIPDTIVVGHIAAGAGRQLVTRSSAALQGYRYVPGRATATWTLPDHDVFAAWDFDRAALYSRPDRLLSIDLDGDGVQDLLTTTPTATSTRLVATAIDGSTLTELASYDLAPGTGTQAAWVIPPVTEVNATLAVSYSDGFMIIHDAALRPAVTGAEFELATLRTGGYYAAGGWRDLRRAPVVAALEAGAPEAIIVSDARGALLRLDASDASWASDPRGAWERLYTGAPSIIDGLIDGSRGIACLSVRDPSAAVAEHDITVLRPDGAEHWRAPAPQSPFLDLVPANLNGDSVPDLVFFWGEPSNTLTRVRGVSGVDGAILWDATPVESGAGRQAAGIAIGRFDGDDRDDVYWQGGATRVLSGADGTELAALGGPSYFMPTLYDVDDDPEREIVLHGGFSPVRIVEHDGSAIVWQSTDDDRPYPYGSVLRCPGDRTVLLSGSWLHRSRLKLTDLRGASRGTQAEVFLASGSSYGSRAELDAASVFAGQLTSVVVHENLAGDGEPAALVGSTDGWLYWVNACDGSLVHALDFGVAVGQAVFGDTNRDGFDEIIVSVADGFLYGIKQRNAPTPANVIDIDPADPASTIDVDFITTADTWIARWDSVSGALRYEIGVFDEDGEPVLAERWRDVGSETEATLTGLALENGRRYHAGVRAYSAAGPSVDGVSDGAIVRFPVPGMDAGPPPGVDGGPPPPGPDAGPSTPPEDGGCGCRVGSRSSARLGWALALLALVALRRRA